MASFCRSALVSGAKSMAARSRFASPKSFAAKPAPSPFSSSASTAIPRPSRVFAALGSVESLMPLHSAIAAARLKSNIATDSSFWSCLSQGFASPL